jgi:GH35 family endo-1,4-beta-xylanase
MSTGKCHPLPFDENFAPKPAVAALLQVLQNATQL